MAGSNNDKSLDELRSLAERGDAAAQFTLAAMCATGQGGPKDEAEAVRWYRAAAAQGDPDSQNNLGLGGRFRS